MEIQKLTESIQQLTTIIQEQNTTIDWTSVISAFCSIISLIAIGLLIKERYERKRPYLQISFELLKGRLVCLVIRNVGEVPAKLKELRFNQEFVNQLPELGRKNAKDKDDLNISIYPKQKWVLCLDIITVEAMHYNNTKLNITYKFTAKGKSKIYCENETIDFNDYKNFLVYVSDIDELSNEIKELVKNIEKMDKTLSTLHNTNI